MNREFKFRAWDKDENVMFYPVVIDYGDYSLRDLTGRWHDMINCELLQYIGFEDCNGREIYEGDILKRENNFFGEEIGIVVYVSGIPCLTTKTNVFPFNCLYLSDWSITGCIYAEK